MLFPHCPEKFRDIYIFTFGWAKEKVIILLFFWCGYTCLHESDASRILFVDLSIDALSCSLYLIKWTSLCSVMIGSEVFGIGHSNRDVATIICWKAVAFNWSLVSVFAGKICEKNRWVGICNIFVHFVKKW